MTTTDAVITLNGEIAELLPSMGLTPIKTPAEIADWATLYEIPRWKKVIVRVGGQFMFVHSRDESRASTGSVIVDLKIDSSRNKLTSNRDGLTWGARQSLNKFVGELYRDPSKIIDVSPSYTVHEGRNKTAISRNIQMGYSGRDMPQIHAVTPAKIAPNLLCAAAALKGQKLVDWIDNYSDVCSNSRVSILAAINAEKRKGEMPYDVVICNDTSLKLPDRYVTGKFNDYDKKLLRRWVAALDAVATVANIQINGKVGFIQSLDASAAATYRQGHWTFFIASHKIVKGSLMGDHDFSIDDWWELVEYAIHELSHMESSYHDTDFVEEYGRITKACMKPANHKVIKSARAKAK